MIQAPESTLSPRGGDFEGARHMARAEELLAELAAIDVPESVVTEHVVEVTQVNPKEDVVLAKEDAEQAALKELKVSTDQSLEEFFWWSILMPLSFN